jgi:excinuclease ABC subunit C
MEEFDAAEFLPSLLKQLYLDAEYLPRYIHTPFGFDDCELLEEVLSEKAGHRVEILNPQRGQKHQFLELVEKNAQQSFITRFRISKPSKDAIVEALEAALGLPEPPKRIECFDISHIQGSDTVASMVVWEDGKMKKADYRKFIIRGEAMPEGGEKATGILRDDFASMQEVVERRYRRLQAENKALPSLILIDGGLGQLHAAAKALDKLAIINQPMASIAKKEEILYVLGREDEPVILDHHSPVLHLIQQIRDETHRFAVTFHRQRRSTTRLRTGLTDIAGIGNRTAQKLLRRFGSVTRLKELSVDDIAAEVPRAQAQRVYDALHDIKPASAPDPAANNL